MAAERKAWHQLPDEPDIWYERFEIFRQLGGVRSIRRTYQIAKEETEANLTGESPNSTWSEKARLFNWVERARAWDEHQREQFREREMEIALDRRLSRLQKIQKLEDDAFAGLLAANIGDMDQTAARAYLPQLRMLIVAMLGLERVEFGGPAEEGDGGSSSELSDEILRNLERSFGKRVAVANGKPSE